MLKHIQHIELQVLFEQQYGSSAIRIGLIDGPVNSAHKDLKNSRIIQLQSGEAAACVSSSSPACTHGTHLAGMLSAGRNSDEPGICPGSPLFVRPIFCEANDLNQCPTVTPQHLAKALHDTLDENVNIINLSLGIGDTGVMGNNRELNAAFNRAFQTGTLLVGASGNQGRIGHNPLFDHAWVIPVAASDEKGALLPQSNIGNSVGQRGVLAPGSNITSTNSTGGYVTLTGTSVATPFVTGSIALLWSKYPKAKGYQIHKAITGHTVRNRKTIIPPLLNMKKSEAYLKTLL